MQQSGKHFTANADSKVGIENVYLYITGNISTAFSTSDYMTIVKGNLELYLVYVFILLRRPFTVLKTYPVIHKPEVANGSEKIERITK